MTKEPLFSSSRDAEIHRLLQKHDPAGKISAQDCFQLETQIMDRTTFEPQLGRNQDIADYFVVPGFLNGPLTWTMTLMSIMTFGLMLGFFIASISEFRTPSYTIKTAMAEPWHTTGQ